MQHQQQWQPHLFPDIDQPSMGPQSHPASHFNPAGMDGWQAGYNPVSQHQQQPQGPAYTSHADTWHPGSGLGSGNAPSSPWQPQMSDVNLQGMTGEQLQQHQQMLWQQQQQVQEHLQWMQQQQQQQQQQPPAGAQPWDAAAQDPTHAQRHLEQQQQQQHPPAEAQPRDAATQETTHQDRQLDARPAATPQQASFGRQLQRALNGPRQARPTTHPQSAPSSQSSTQQAQVGAWAGARPNQLPNDQAAPVHSQPGAGTSAGLSDAADPKQQHPTPHAGQQRLARAQHQPDQDHQERRHQQAADEATQQSQQMPGAGA